MNVTPIVLWDDLNRGKVVSHGVTPAEVEEVFADDSTEEGVSRSSGRPLVRGYTRAGRFLVVVYDELDDNPLRVYPVTAYSPGE